MFRLLRLPFWLIKLAVMVAVVVYVWRRLPSWVGEDNVSKAVHVIQQGVALILELIGKLKDMRV